MGLMRQTLTAKPRHCEERPAFARSASYGGLESAEARKRVGGRSNPGPLPNPHPLAAEGRVREFLLGLSFVGLSFVGL